MTKLNNIPVTSREAFRILDEMIPSDERVAMALLPRSDFSADEHMRLGLWIRNNWIHGDSAGMSEQQKERRDKCLRMLTGEKDNDVFLFVNPDIASSRFLERYHDHLRRIYKIHFD